MWCFIFYETTLWSLSCKNFWKTAVVFHRYPAELKNNARQIVVLLCPKGSSCLFYYYKLLRCRIVTNLRNCFLTKLPLRMYFLMSVISFFRTDFYIEEGDGILMSGNLNSVMVHEMKSHLGLFQSSK